MSQRLQLLKQDVRAIYENPLPEGSPWADMWLFKNHVEVVEEISASLAKKYNGNEEFVRAAALLHDIADPILHRHSNPEKFEELNKELALRLLSTNDFDKNEQAFILENIILNHDKSGNIHEFLESKILASADGIAHMKSQFYTYFCWNHFPRKVEDYEGFKKWLLIKIDKDFQKIHFEDEKKEIKPLYNSYKTIFSF